jgi:pSer/pThr/pTyr-binding forkhead associated (FHA) protein
LSAARSTASTARSTPRGARRRRFTIVTVWSTSLPEFFFSKDDETTIGRADPVTGILPDIDLTPVDANRSVSRRHAKIIRSGHDYCVLEEVGTVNGTYVNEQRIPTGMPVTIHNGDAIKIGLIAMKAVFD